MTPSLIPLKAALIAAEKLTPPRPPRPDPDLNRMPVKRLISRFRESRLMPLTGLQIEPPQPMIPAVRHKMAGRDV
jgi:hypothetical protein